MATKRPGTLRLTFCRGSCTPQALLPHFSSLHSVSFQAWLEGHTQEASGSPQLGSDLCRVSARPLERLPPGGPQLPCPPTGWSPTQRWVTGSVKAGTVRTSIPSLIHSPTPYTMLTTRQGTSVVYPSSYPQCLPHAVLSTCWMDVSPPTICLNCFLRIRAELTQRKAVNSCGSLLQTGSLQALPVLHTHCAGAKSMWSF